jgi:tRNA (cmo5U34)-methyltransferase
MGVAEHLGIETDEYDRQILTFIPHYDDILNAAAKALDALDRPAELVVDLGTGSGALAHRCLKRLRGARVVGIDTDVRMLEMAKRRLGPKLTTVVADFERADIPACDVITASFSLHHVKTPDAKAALFARAYAALRPGGLLVDADCTLATNPHLQRRDHEDWRNHLAETHGTAGARKFLRAWAGEDTYFTLDEEAALLRQAGFDVDVPWRRGSFAVIAAARARRRTMRAGSHS